jgi:hypothetical protein
MITVETNAVLGSLNGRTYLQRYGNHKSNRMMTVPNSNSGITRIQVQVDKATDAFEMNGAELLTSSKFNESIQDRESIRPANGTVEGSTIITP